MDVTMTMTDVTSFGQGSMEAIIKSQQIWTAGIQDIARSITATRQVQMTQTIAVLKALAGAKSLPEAMELQSHYARGLLDSMMAESGRLTAASMKLAEDSMAPIKARMSLAAETFKPTDG